MAFGRDADSVHGPSRTECAPLAEADAESEHGRTEEEDVEDEVPEPPGERVATQGAGAQRVPSLQLGQGSAHGVPELRLVPRPGGRRRRRLTDAAQGDRTRTTAEPCCRSPSTRWEATTPQVPILEGAHAAADSGLAVVLVGPEGLAGRTTPGGIELDLIVASEVIEMDDDPAQGVRRKKDSTLVRAAEAVRDGRASAMISAGNTGATMAAALLRMGRISGVKRPAIATPIPVPGSTPTVLLDAGANSEVHAEWLVQFAVMGSVYARHRFDIESPRVGLLSIGEEPGKGDTLRKDAYELLVGAPGIDFVGNIEGRDVMSDAIDVCVTDGFTGNVVLKTLEGGMRAVVSALIAAFGSEPHYQPHADALMPALLPLYEALTPDTYGGAILLGVDGVCIIAHGSSGATAIHNGIRVAAEMVAHGMVDEIRAAIAAAS